MALEVEMADPELWNDQDRGRRVQKDLAAVIEDLDLYAALTEGIEDAETLVEMAVEAGDDSLEPEIGEAVESLSGRFDDLELRSRFSGQYDEGDAVKERGEATINKAEDPAEEVGITMPAAPSLREARAAGVHTVRL